MLGKLEGLLLDLGSKVVMFCEIVLCREEVGVWKKKGGRFFVM